MCNINLIFAYFSPETPLPVGSIVATVLGVAMMLGRGSVRILIRCIRRVVRRSTGTAGLSRPHFRLQEKGEAPTAHTHSDEHAIESA